MFTFLSKFLPLFVYPLGLASFVLLISLLFWKKRRFAMFCVIVAFAALFIGGNKYVAYSLARSLEWQYLPTSTIQRADVIVVLGGATEPALAPRPEVELNSAADRLIHGAALYNAGVSDHLLLSGGDIDFLSLSSDSPASDMESIMLMLGVPKKAIWLQGNSQNTYEDALYSCKMIKEHNAKSIVLVTSATHMPRAVAVFEKQGCHVTPSPADFNVTEAAWANLWSPDWQEVLLNLVPSYSNLSMTTKSLKEYIGLITYRLKGWA